MTQVTIQTQIDAIRKATEIASKSKESATQFLIDAGIIKSTPTQNENHPKKSK